MVTSNILDPIHSSLPAEVWQKPDDPEPILRPTHAHFITSHIYKVLEHGGYHNPHRWLKLFLTGSLCTYQYSHESDADVSLFVDSKNLPEWSRAEMIGLMIEGCDGITLPGTPYELQAYVVARGIHPTDLYQPHLRPGYDIAAHHWISPPDQSLARDTKTQKNGFYAWALQGADKMERLLRYEPDKAVDYWHQIHRKRMRDQTAGKGDYSESNILYKFLFKRGLVPQLAELTGEHIANLDGRIEEVMDFEPQGQSNQDNTRYTTMYEEQQKDDSLPERIASPNIHKQMVANTSLSEQIYSAIRGDGGITISLSGQQPAAGFAFSAQKYNEQVVPLNRLTPQLIDQYIASHRAELSAPNRFFGAWVSDGNVYLDVSQVEPEQNRAEELARGANQLAYWDIANSREVPLSVLT